MNEHNNTAPPSPQHKPTFASPQSGIPDHKQKKTSIILNQDDINKLDSWRNRPGTITRTLAIVTAKLVAALERNGFNDYDPDRFEQYIAECDFTFPDGTNPSPHTPTNGTPVAISILTPSQTDSGNERLGVSGVPRPRKKTPTKRANA